MNNLDWRHVAVAFECNLNSRPGGEKKWKNTNVLKYVYKPNKEWDNCYKRVVIIFDNNSYSPSYYA
jgi:hypothetical protein